MPYMSSPPGRSARSKTVTQWPALFNCAAALIPAGPEPTTATFFSVRNGGGSGTTQPSSQALSMMAHSMVLMVTGGALMPSTQEPSHGAGQTRRSEEHTSELQSQSNLVCRLLLEKKNKIAKTQ